MIIIKNQEEIEKMRRGGRILGKILKQLGKEIKAGMTTWQLEERARDLIAKAKVKPAFLDYRGYPAVLCVSVNEEVVHGIPSKEKIIREGDLVSLDLGIIREGMITDAAITIAMGKISSEEQKLLEITRSALRNAVKEVKVGKKVSDISRVIENTVKKEGLEVIRDCVGHGVGKEVHEDPLVPNFFSPLNSEILKPGMTIAIEPIATLGKFPTETKTGSMGWVVITADKAKTAHFEQTVLVTEKGGEIITPF